MAAPKAVRMLVNLSLGGKPLNENHVYTDPWTTDADRENLINAGWAEPIDDGTEFAVEAGGGIIENPGLFGDTNDVPEAVVPLNGITGSEALIGTETGGRAKRAGRK